MRGNRLQNAHLLNSVRSIPACAGEPKQNSIFDFIIEVYPRVCGGTYAKAT